jgi:hypothetical protein
MKKNRFIVGIIICFLMLGLVWWLLHKKQYSSLWSENTNSVLQSQVQNAKTATTKTPKPKTEAKQPTAVSSSVPAAVVEYVRKIKADPAYDWKQPINFYGRVVDESKEPVAGANAHFEWTDLSPNGSSHADRTSDGNGFFSLTGEHGKRMSVTVSKDGYYTYPSERLSSYEYANPADGLFTPDPVNPVVFHLREKGPGAELVHIARSIRVPRDGSPIYVDLFTGNRVVAGQGQLEVRCLTSGEKDAENRYDWRCSIAVFNGGITEATEEFPFEAPTNGYQSKIELNMLKSEPNWHPSIEGQYFLKLQDGNFARLHFEMISFGDHFCTIDYFLNPNGSRNLEPAN